MLGCELADGDCAFLGEHRLTAAQGLLVEVDLSRVETKTRNRHAGEAAQGLFDGSGKPPALDLEPAIRGEQADRTVKPYAMQFDSDRLQDILLAGRRLARHRRRRGEHRGPRRLGPLLTYSLLRSGSQSPSRW